MGAELFNLYVEKLLQEVTELTKTKILLSAQLAYYEKLNAELNNRVTDMEKALNKASSKAQKKTDTSDF